MGVIGKTLRFALGLGIGAGLGAVAAMLVAPQSGKVTKERIQERVDEIVKAGKTAQNRREKELLEYWEEQLALKSNA
jgi:gas vesicle protein